MKYLTLLAATLATVHTWANERSITLIASDQKKIFTLTELRSHLETVTVTINDPVYSKQKTYDGFKLGEVLKLLGPVPQQSDEMVFTSLDGYAPTLSISEYQAHQPILTFKEHGIDGFEKVQQGKAFLDPAPFYLVWSDWNAVGKNFPWPYQLASIEVVSFKKKYPKIYPFQAAATSKEMKGFLVFKTTCIRCHSINLEGGELAPELNIPKNVTEYWQPKILQSFIRNASSFRLKSKMPSFEKDLTSSQVDDVITYLKAMRNRKILPK